jgi:hypothetical protein
LSENNVGTTAIFSVIACEEAKARRMVNLPGRGLYPRLFNNFTPNG